MTASELPIQSNCPKAIVDRNKECIIVSKLAPKIRKHRLRFDTIGVLKKPFAAVLTVRTQKLYWWETSLWPVQRTAEMYQ